jgi:NAD(P)-dependent dehydrogenase (short-subunit alcohol dehydrogenase family)
MSSVIASARHSLSARAPSCTCRPPGDPTAGRAAFSLSKAALSYLIRILDLELCPHGIRVSAVTPQLIDTAADRATLPAALLTHAVRPEAIANVIAFLAGVDR